MENNVEIVVYGAEQLCELCQFTILLKETFEWLQAAIARKFPDQPFPISYVDIFYPPAESSKQRFA